MATKEKVIEILEYKIAEIDRLLSNFSKYNISEKKSDMLLAKKNKYQQQLSDLQST